MLITQSSLSLHGQNAYIYDGKIRRSSISLFSWRWFFGCSMCSGVGLPARRSRLIPVPFDIPTHVTTPPRLFAAIAQ
jgi:hypothetical protein